MTSDTPPAGAGGIFRYTGVAPFGAPLHLQTGVWSFMRLNKEPSEKEIRDYLTLLSAADGEELARQLNSLPNLISRLLLSCYKANCTDVTPPSSTRRSFKTDFRQPVLGGSNLGAVRIGLFPIEVLDDLDFIYTGKIFLKERKVGASFCIAPFDFNH
jgi:hypothetical protein